MTTEAVNATTPIMIQGKPCESLPEDLYIPPDALEVVLENFSGPLDLLLYLIKKQNLDIPIAKITHQYVSYIELMQVLKIELAAEYLVMAAMLAEIKSRLLLPKLPSEAGEEEEDPRAELVRRLVEYERFKQAAENLDELPRQERDFFPAKPVDIVKNWARPEPVVELDMLINALAHVIQRQQWQTHHAVKLETLSLRQRMTEVLEKLNEQPLCEFERLFVLEEGRVGIVLTFIAILELARQSMLEIVQSNPLATIYLQKPKTVTVHERN